MENKIKVEKKKKKKNKENFILYHIIHIHLI